MRGFFRFSSSPAALFIFSFVVLFFLLGLHKVLFLRPQSIHQWAQCDRASVAWNYYVGGYDFFHPRVNNIANGSGITGLEFPVIQYCVALLYGVFGFHEWIYRLLTLFTCACGLFCAWRISEHSTGSRSLASLMIIFLACSPLLAYYSISFIPDLYSMSFLLISWYMLFISRNKPSNPNLLLHCLCFAMACLIKPTALIYVPAFAIYYFRSVSQTGWKRSILRYAVCSVGVVSLTVSWYAYASWLSKTEESGVFLLKTRPVKDLNQLLEISNLVVRQWLERITNVSILVVLGLSFLTSSFVSRKSIPTVSWMAIATLPGICLYFWQMGRQFPDHDYYALLMLPVLVFILIGIADFRTQLRVPWIRKALLCGVLAVIAMQFYDAKTHIRVSHNKGSWKYGDQFYDLYFDAEGFFARAGIPGNEPVISAFDISPNVSLYLMGRKGVSAADESKLSQLLDSHRFPGIRYVLINDHSIERNERFNPGQYNLKLLYQELPLRVFVRNDTTLALAEYKSGSTWN